MAMVTLPAIARRAGVANMTAFRRFKKSTAQPDAIILDVAGHNLPAFLAVREGEIRKAITQ